MPNTANLTPNKIERFRNEEGRAVLRDSHTRYLTVERRHKGQASFVYYRWYNGRPRKRTIGQVGVVNLSFARNKAAGYSAEIAAGRNPFDQSKSLTAKTTLGELWAFWQDHSAAHKKARSIENDNSLWKNHLLALSKRRLVDLTRADVQSLHLEIGKKKKLAKEGKKGKEATREVNGPYVANRVLSLLSSMFNWAANIGYVGQNPCKGIKRHDEAVRKRILLPDEMTRFFQALDDEPNQSYRDLFYLSLYTTARRQNLLEMRWENLRLDGPIPEWEIPETKSGGSGTVDLPKEAVEILNRRKPSCGDSPWVFPSHGKTGHIVEPKAAWGRILTRAQIGNLRLHDLRRTLTSMGAQAGYSMEMLRELLTNKTQASVKHYAHLRRDHIRTGRQHLVDEIEKTRKPKLTVADSA